MSDISNAGVAAVAAALAPVPEPAKTNWLVADAHWVLAHAWSTRFLVVAVVLSILEAVLPLVLKPVGPTQHIVFAVVIGLTTGAALISRFVAQKKAGVSNG